MHWLLGMAYVKLDSLALAQIKLEEMKRIIADNAIDETNYRMGIYKYMLHLEACLAVKKTDKDLRTVENRIAMFDGPIKNKVKDHTSPFDLAFFNTSFGELYMEMNELDLAEIRLKKALEYNPNYALAHYNLEKVYSQKGEREKAQEALERFRELWNGADADVKELYSIAELTPTQKVF